MPEMKHEHMEGMDHSMIDGHEKGGEAEAPVSHEGHN
jgi:hypothetical protein